MRILMTLFLLLPVALAAQEVEENTLPEPIAGQCTAPEYRQFDFWLGDWDVHVASGSFAGHNTIERTQRGCVLIENWTSASGNTGMSINYVDDQTGEWVQVWNAGSGSQINIRGGLTDAGMLLVGTIHYVANGQTLPFRGLWTPLEDGRVRQFFERRPDEFITQRNI